ncbi:MAG: hypothetical protein OEN20_06060 [Gammaproteobacteria bacterium]|nr:hypothetical protein [Gammaproteobacteria bacterium]
MAKTTFQGLFTQQEAIPEREHADYPDAEVVEEPRAAQAASAACSNARA